MVPRRAPLEASEEVFWLQHKFRSFLRKRESRVTNREVTNLLPWVPAFAGTSG